MVYKGCYNNYISQDVKGLQIKGYINMASSEYKHNPEWRCTSSVSSIIKHKTAKATLIHIPNTSLLFYHPTKLVHTDKNTNTVSIMYTELFEFRVFKVGGVYSEYTSMSAEQLEELFDKAMH